MIICPIALAVGCKKCPAFSFCPLTTVLGDQQEENKVWEENFPPEKKNQITITGTNTYDSVRSKLKRLEKEFDIWEESYPPEKNKNEESEKE
jgi:hypothetical protein